ncbi:hypothetical protein B0J14DRAFT_684940 [Halenospora varia]|nr:hypothetical protein B0J14DRAFT_684940 [Halenospora varia]
MENAGQVPTQQPERPGHSNTRMRNSQPSLHSSVTSIRIAPDAIPSPNSDTGSSQASLHGPVTPRQVAPEAAPLPDRAAIPMIPPTRPGFATVSLFRSFFPKADPYHPHAKKWYCQRGVILNTASITSGFVLLLNFIGTLVLYLHYGNAEIFKGDCDNVSNLSTGIHVVINLLSSLLLGASNLSMQLLVAPTRKEVDEAHRNKIWLDIGVPSLRNLKHIALRKRVAGWILGISSLPLHFLYNSAIFSTLPTNTINLILIRPSFLTGASFNPLQTTATIAQRRNITTLNRERLPPYHIVEQRQGSWSDNNQNDWNVTSACVSQGLNCTSVQAKAISGGFNKNMTVQECLTLHTSWFGNKSDVLLISTQDLLESRLPPQPTNNSFLFAKFSPGFAGPGMYWPCFTSSFDCRKPYLWNRDPSIIKDWNIMRYKIDYCLGYELDSQQYCSVKYSMPIMISIIFTAYLYESKGDSPLATIGDAAVSFLTTPDLTTDRTCLINMNLISNDDRKRSLIRSLMLRFPRIRATLARLRRKKPREDVWRTPRPLTWQDKKPRWSQTATGRRWFWAVFPCIALISTGSGFLALAVETIQRNQGSTGYWRQLGFGTPNEYSQGRLGLNGYIGNLRMNDPSVKKMLLMKSLGGYYVYLYTDIIVANIWQFFLSMLYIQYNSLLTCILANLEWHRYFKHRKALRVSFPIGLQRESSYFVSMPW